METTVLTPKEEKRELLKKQLQPIDETFSMFSDDDVMLVSNISHSHQNRLFTLTSLNTGKVLDSWYEPLN